MAAKGAREAITLECTECKRRNYTTEKNKKNNTERLEVEKYCKFCKKNTTHKITIVLITAAVVFALDFVFENMNKYGINKIKETVESHKQEENTEGENANEENAENSENNGETENGTEDNTAEAENKEVE